MFGTLGNLIKALPVLLFIAAIFSLFEKDWGPAFLGFLLSILLFWLVYLRKKKSHAK